VFAGFKDNEEDGLNDIDENGLFDPSEKSY